MKCSRKWWPRILILLASVLMAGPIIRGLVESLADALAAMLKLWAGQRAGVKPLQRKPMVMLVYGLATLSRPLIALAIRVLSHCWLMNVVWAGTNASSSIWTDFPCQCIKLVGKRQLDTAFQQKLTFANHVHQLDAGQDAFGGAK